MVITSVALNIYGGFLPHIVLFCYCCCPYTTIIISLGNLTKSHVDCSFYCSVLL